MCVQHGRDRSVLESSFRTLARVSENVKGSKMEKERDHVCSGNMNGCDQDASTWHWNCYDATCCGTCSLHSS